MPGLTVATDARPAPVPANTAATSAAPCRASTSTRSPSPTRPPVSPITPTLSPTQLPAGCAAATTTVPPPTATVPQSALSDFALGRPAFTHTSQTDQVGAAPPPAQPIDFDSNPDVLALKSAISILQLQRARATADIQSLSHARKAALADPAAFIADLNSGRVRIQGDPLTTGAPAVSAVPDSDDDSSSDDDEGDSEQPGQQEDTPDSETKPGNADTPMTDGTNPPPTKPKQPTRKKGKQKQPPSTTTPAPPAPPPWLNLPKPQSIVRCPPINWAQYGVIGESLDKLHAEQLAAPNPGAPAVLGPGGTYEFKAGEQGAAGGVGGPGRRLVGVAAPFSPMRDRVERKGRGGRK
ncbi:hypothetical protein C8A05DRAFT_33888 [Staphylotrichum tortipilum]|uniref:Uncharacterized protein n=1 Tax=Staphylotrichum tortipilum TaxID=2831512 RepID=A0AAN6MK61_9PEZI|nr:hypothetical protein C8A05DRAFT_33888 [Staphylotrichum longicolle]